MDQLTSAKRFSQPCENNKAAILKHLTAHFAATTHVLEIGSGTGQHAAFFAPALPHLSWQPTDVVENHASISAWIEESKCTNTLPISCFFVGQDEWCFESVDGVYSANTAHIMQYHEVQLMMESISSQLPAKGIFCQYGPFKIDGKYTSQSNQEFDSSLRERGYGGIRDIAELAQWADDMVLAHNHYMPANNQLLVWQKQT